MADDDDDWENMDFDDFAIDDAAVVSTDGQPSVDQALLKLEALARDGGSDIVFESTQDKDFRKEIRNAALELGLEYQSTNNEDGSKNITVKVGSGTFKRKTTTKTTISKGDGRTFPAVGEEVYALSMHYTGWLHDGDKPKSRGSKFDSSVDRGKPFSFQIGKGKVIKGWDTMIMTMSVGEKAELLVPSHEAYGKAGIADKIPPNSDLLFEIELLQIYRSS